MSKSEAGRHRPPVIHGIRPSTLQLFGLFLVHIRQSFDLTIDEIASRSKKPASWHAAVERGELLPTPQQLMMLNLAYRDTAPRPDEALIRLHTEPWGDLATYIRSKYQLPPPQPASHTGDDDMADSVFPLLDEIGRYDRLFVLGPMLLASLLLASYLNLDPLSGGGPTFTWPDLEPYLAIGSLLLVGATFGIPTIGRLIADTTRRLRLALARKPMTSVQKFRASEWIDGPSTTLSAAHLRTNWFRPNEVFHMPAAIRSPIRSWGVAAELTERLALLLGLSSAVLLSTYVYSLTVEPGVPPNSATDSPRPSHDAIWLLLAIVAASSTWISSIASQTAGRWFARYFGIGLGLVSEDQFVGDELKPSS